MKKSKKTFKSILVKKKKEDEKRKAEQHQLKEKYNVSETDVVIVEKRYIMKFVLELSIAFLHIVFKIIMIILAGIGLLSLLYPPIRSELFKTLQELWLQLLQYI